MGEIGEGVGRSADQVKEEVVREGVRSGSGKVERCFLKAVHTKTGKLELRGER